MENILLLLGLVAAGAVAAAASSVQPFSSVIGICGELTETPLSVLDTLISRSNRRTNLNYRPS